MANEIKTVYKIPIKLVGRSMLWYGDCWGWGHREWEMMGMMRIELTTFCTEEVPVERVEDVDVDVQIAVKMLISLYQVHVVQL